MPKTLEVKDCVHRNVSGICLHSQRVGANCFVKVGDTCTLDDSNHYTLRYNDMTTQIGDKVKRTNKKAPPPAPPAQTGLRPPPRRRRSADQAAPIR